MSNHVKFVFSLSTLMFVPVFWHFATVFGVLGEPLVTRGEFFSQDWSDRSRLYYRVGDHCHSHGSAQ